MKHIDIVWQRIERLEGIELQTKTGKPFTFDVSGNVITTSRTDYNIARSDVERALKLVPLEGPGVINEIVRGPAYIWALLHHPDVRDGDW